MSYRKICEETFLKFLMISHWCLKIQIKTLANLQPYVMSSNSKVRHLSTFNLSKDQNKSYDHFFNSIRLWFPGGSAVKDLPANARDLGSIPGSVRSPGKGNGNPFQYSCLENPMDRGAWWATVHGVTESDMTKLLHVTPALQANSLLLSHQRSPTEGLPSPYYLKEPFFLHIVLPC